MHPALSVVFFTTVSGAGYGLLFVLGLQLAFGGVAPASPLAAVLGATLASAGLLASLAHLGHPERAWRALSQWRSSWLSREGVAAALSYLPIVAAIALPWLAVSSPVVRLVGIVLALAAATTVWCTARIYTSLTPIPAWQHRLVLPGYLGFAGLSGLAWWSALALLSSDRALPIVALLLLALALIMLALKWRYWHAIDCAPLPVTLAAATGLRGAHGMRPFEAPHTETNYLLREMGYVLARKHASKLRAIALIAIAIGTALAALGAGTAMAWPVWFALLLLHIGLFVERRLFFAQARHLVSVYYRG